MQRNSMGSLREEPKLIIWAMLEEKPHVMIWAVQEVERKGLRNNTGNPKRGTHRNTRGNCRPTM